MKYDLTTVVALLAAVASAAPTPADSSARTDASDSLAQLENRATTCSNSATNKLLFTASMKTFQTARAAKNPSKCIWTTDNCSKSPDKPDGYNFIPSCQRHDFGYRNTKNQNRFTKAMKKRIDDNLKHDLYNYCSQFSGWESWKGVECRRIADTYYIAVRQFGKRNIEMDPETQAYRKRADEFEDLDGSDFDLDIEGEDIPEIADGESEDLDGSDFDLDIEARDVSEIADDESEGFDSSEFELDIESRDVSEIADDGSEDFDTSDLGIDIDIESRDVPEIDESEDLDGSEFDADIEGQDIPEIADGEGEDFEDLEEELSSE